MNKLKEFWDFGVSVCREAGPGLSLLMLASVVVLAYASWQVTTPEFKNMRLKCIEICGGEDAVHGVGYTTCLCRISCNNNVSLGPGQEWCAIITREYVPRGVPDREE